MALPIHHRTDERIVQTVATTCANGIAGVARAPCQGRIVEVGGMLGSVLATADATCTVSIAGTAITGGNWVVTQSGSAIGDLDFASTSGVGNGGLTANTNITGANTCNEGDLIKFAFTGSGTAGGDYYCYAVVIPVS